MLGTLIHGEVDGERLSHDELVQNCIFLLNAGHETTTNLIGNTVDALLRFPDELARLLAEPGLIKSCVEEGLRFESSNQLGNRRLPRRSEIGGETLPAGTYIHIGIGAANRDPAQFPEPDRFDAGREPNRHVAFGSGVHMCLGAVLARLEGTIAIGRLVAPLDGLARDGAPERGGRARFRGFTRYPIAWEKATSIQDIARCRARARAVAGRREPEPDPQGRCGADRGRSRRDDCRRIPVRPSDQNLRERAVRDNRFIWLEHAEAPEPRCSGAPARTATVDVDARVDVRSRARLRPHDRPRRGQVTIAAAASGP